MAPITPEERKAAGLYRDAILDLGKEWIASAERAMELRRQSSERFDDPDWQSALIGEARTWRELLNRIPGEPPPLAKDMHTSVVRWFAASANRGDEFIAAIESGDRDRVKRLSVAGDEINALIEAALRAAQRVSERLSERPGGS